MSTKWNRIDESDSKTLPKSITIALAYYVNTMGKCRIVRAVYTEAMTIPVGCDNYDEWGDYDEEKDEYFCPEGWYEWNEHEEIHWKVDGTVTHWMTMPEGPK